jgi:hypothetical protein
MAQKYGGIRGQWGAPAAAAISIEGQRRNANHQPAYHYQYVAPPPPPPRPVQPVVFQPPVSGPSYPTIRL